jgi:Domain of Unknown Function with PDB structure (DUF3857)
MPQKTISLFISFFFLTFNLFSQAENWGVVSAADLKMTVYPEDTSAKAVILQDVGDINFENDEGNIIIKFNRRRRIKVFDQSAFKEGNLLIEYRTNDDTRFLDLEVLVFSPDGEKTVVKTSNIYNEKLSKYWSAKKIFIPNLQKGCIIEYRYELKTNSFIRLTPWEFQDDLPIRWSEIKAQIPQFYNYITLSNISLPLAINESITKDQKFSLAGQNYSVVYFRKALKNIPALKREAYITTLDDYRNQIQFQLKEYVYPGQSVRKFFDTWETLSKEFYDDKQFGDQFTKSSKYKLLFEAANPILIDASLSEDEKLKKLQQFVSSNIKWNNISRIWTENGINEAFKDHQGNMAEINLGLLALCKEAGFKAYPLLTSTRAHGYVIPEYPLIDQFNCVLVCVEGKDKTYKILDATNPFYGINQTDDQNYNRKAWIAREKNPEWIDIKAPEKIVTYFGNLALDGEGNLKGTVRISFNGNLASEFREKIANEKGLSYLKQEFLIKNEEMSFDSLVIENQNDFSKPLNFKFNIAIPNAAQVANDYLYCPAVLMNFVEENPFKALTRYCPINFESTWKSQYVFSFKTPEGYKVEDMPTAINLSLQNDGGKISFSAGKTVNDETQVVLRVNLKQIDFTTEEYPNLQQFFSKIVEKNEDQIVFKKM